MDLYHLILFVHVASATVWLGAAIVLELFEWQVVRATSRERMQALVARSTWFGPRVFMPAGLLTIASGVTLVFMGGFGLSQTWIVVALLGVAATALIGAGVLGRSSERFSKLLGNPETSEATIRANLLKFKIFAQVDLAILVWILFDMVMKPAASDTAFFVLSASFFVIVALYALERLYRRE